jgi:hypothetical protein
MALAAMKDRKTINETELEVRQRLVSLANAMLEGTLSFFEGAPKVHELKDKVGGVADRDEDFDAFLVIQSETDHLPLEKQKHLWSKNSIANLEQEFKKTEEWAGEFAPQACKNIIARFGSS